MADSDVKRGRGRPAKVDKSDKEVKEKEVSYFYLAGQDFVQIFPHFQHAVTEKTGSSLSK